MPIVWRDQMSVANHLIDMDHRLLICKINMIELALQVPGEELANLKLALDQLEDYTVKHFEREERLQVAINYPSWGDHKNLHQSLVERLQEIKAQVLEDEDSSRLATEAPRITELLRDWLLVHVLKEDMKLKPYLAKFPKNYSA